MAGGDMATAGQGVGYRLILRHDWVAVGEGGGELSEPVDGGRVGGGGDRAGSVQSGTPGVVLRQRVQVGVSVRRCVHDRERRTEQARAVVLRRAAAGEA